ncbi:helix-turn-helix domain-containing protein [Streptomyces hygroscopicus]|uniref:helix-turn-helix domain-containing protein n=1 Tax=Streptomyces hygroscopicus TaxID=1912 RepID=UPI0007670AF6|nr:helix-turn-helix domain-containing protein [Streptomyces hygroscopicus]GLV74664.1 putative transcriptional regulator, AraC [Streptomyces hygroscopicus subsp. hygroscopicus]
MSSQKFVRAGVGRGLGGMVVSAVGYRSQGIPPRLHRGLPSPYLTLIFSLDGPVVGGVTPEQARGPGASREEIVVGGLHQRPAYIVQPGCEAGVQLAVHPLAARTLLGLPAGALASDLVTSGTDVLGKRVAEVRERLCEQRSWADRFATLGGYLREQAAAGEGGTPVRSEVAEAWAWLARHRGAGTLNGLAEHVALSPRRLTSVFRAETGLSPKQAARLTRFQHARNAVVRAVAAGRAPDLARVAADCGYYDHSHLVRDFRQYTGVSPTAWLAEECRNIQAGGHLYGEE